MSKSRYARILRSQGIEKLILTLSKEMTMGNESCVEGSCSEESSYCGQQEVSSEVVADLAKRFNWHPPTDVKGKQHEYCRETFKKAAFFICENVPQGRERSIALTKLEECLTWCNAGIARN